MDRLANLIAHLPPESSLLRVVPIPDDAPERPWTRIEQLTAMLVEGIDGLTKVQVRMWAKNPPKMDPLRIEWPGREDTPKPTPSGPDEVVAFLASRRGSIEVIGDDGGS